MERALVAIPGLDLDPTETALDMPSVAATLPFPQNRPPHYPAVKGLFFECLQYNS